MKKILVYRLLLSTLLCSFALYAMYLVDPFLTKFMESKMRGEAVFVQTGNPKIKFEQENMVVTELPHLGITLKTPIKNAMYRQDGAVDSMINHHIKLNEEFGFTVNDLQRITNVYKNVRALCSTFNVDMNGVTNRICTTFMLKQSSDYMTLILMSHEEMHVVQNLGIQEAFDVLKERFRNRGFIINWEYFNNEEQAIIVSMLRVSEMKLSSETADPNDLMLIFQLKDFPSAFNKYRECRIKEFDKVLFMPINVPDFALVFLLQNIDNTP